MTPFAAKMIKLPCIRFGIQMAGIMVMTVAGVCIVGHVTQTPGLYTWPENTVGMAMPTAILFAVVGMCLIALANRKP